jgi:hypothetical protein
MKFADILLSTPHQSTQKSTLLSFFLLFISMLKLKECEEGDENDSTIKTNLNWSEGKKNFLFLLAEFTNKFIV